MCHKLLLHAINSTDPHGMGESGDADHRLPLLSCTSCCRQGNPSRWPARCRSAGSREPPVFLSRNSAGRTERRHRLDGGWPTFTFFVKVGSGKVGHHTVFCRARSGADQSMGSCEPGTERPCCMSPSLPTFTKKVKVGHPPTNRLSIRNCCYQALAQAPSPSGPERR